MIPEMKEILKKDIKKMRAKLLAQKKKTGAYDEIGNLRYEPPRLYLKIQDYKGGLGYMEWFDKNFPEDLYWPEFLFEWTIFLYMNDKTPEAAQKAADTLLMNEYIFDKYFGRSIPAYSKSDDLTVEGPLILDSFRYSEKKNLELEEFSKWLKDLEQKEEFISYIDYYRKAWSEL